MKPQQHPQTRVTPRTIVELSMAARRPSGEEDDEADEGDCCPFASRDVNLALLACASCPPRTSPMRDLVSSSIEGALPNLNLFFDALIIYVLSREWFDLIRIYLFGLYTRPYCSTRTFPPPPPDFPFSPPAPIVPPQAPAPQGGVQVATTCRSTGA